MSGRTREPTSRKAATSTLAPVLNPAPMPAQPGPVASSPHFEHRFSDLSVFAQAPTMLHTDPAGDHNWLAQQSQRLGPPAPQQVPPEGVTRLQRRYASLKDDIQGYKVIHRDMRDRRAEHSIVGFWSDTLGGADLPDYARWTELEHRLFEAKLLLKPGADEARLRRAEGLLDGAEQTITDLAKRLGQYSSDSVKGSERAVTGLETVRDSSKMAVDAMSGGKLGAVYGGVQQLAQQSTEVAYGQREGVDFKGIALNTATDFIAGKISNRLGVGQKVNGWLGGKAASSLTGKLVRGAASEFIDEKVGDAINLGTNTALGQAVGFETAPSWGDTGRAMLENLTKFDPVDMATGYARRQVAGRMARDSAHHSAADAARRTADHPGQVGQARPALHPAVAPHPALTEPHGRLPSALVLNPHLQPVPPQAGPPQTSAPHMMPPVAAPHPAVAPHPGVAPRTPPAFGGLMLNPHLQPVPSSPAVHSPVAPQPGLLPASPHAPPARAPHPALPTGLRLNPHLQPTAPEPGPSRPHPPVPLGSPGSEPHRGPHDGPLPGRGLVLNPHLQPAAAHPGAPSLASSFAPDEPTQIKPLEPTAKTQVMEAPSVLFPDEPTLVGAPPVPTLPPTATTQVMTVPTPQGDDARAYAPQEAAQLRELDRRVGIQDVADAMVARYGDKLARFDALPMHERYQIIEMQNELFQKHFTAQDEARAAPVSPDVTFMIGAPDHEYGLANPAHNSIRLNNASTAMAGFTGPEDTGMGGTHAHEFGHFQQVRQAQNPNGFIDAQYGQDMGQNARNYITPGMDFEAYRHQAMESDSRRWGQTYNESIWRAFETQSEARAEARFQKQFEALKSKGAQRAAAQQTAPSETALPEAALSETAAPQPASPPRALAHTVSRADPAVGAALQRQRAALMAPFADDFADQPVRLDIPAYEEPHAAKREE